MTDTEPDPSPVLYAGPDGIVHSYPPAQKEVRCQYGDPLCPCNDGNACHYVEVDGALTASIDAYPNPSSPPIVSPRQARQILDEMPTPATNPLIGGPMEPPQVAPGDKMHEAFKVIEPSGKTYRVFANGQIDGFKLGAIVFNYIPPLLASGESTQIPENDQWPMPRIALPEPERTPLGEKLADSIIKEQEAPDIERLQGGLAECRLQQVGLAIEAAEDAWIKQAGDARDGLQEQPTDTLPQAMGRAAVAFAAHFTDALNDRIYTQADIDDVHKAAHKSIMSKGNLGELVEDAVALNHQLHAARYAYHKQVSKRYGDMTTSGLMTVEEARERYRLAMLNYDGIIEVAADGHLTEADEADMAKGFPL